MTARAVPCRRGGPLIGPTPPPWIKCRSLAAVQAAENVSAPTTRGCCTSGAKTCACHPPTDDEEMMASSGDGPPKHTASLWSTRGGSPCFVCVGAASWPLERHGAAFRRVFTAISTLVGSFAPISPTASADSRRSTRGAAAGGRRCCRCSFNCCCELGYYVTNVVEWFDCVFVMY